ncbi:hypothetical protein OYC64_016261 [Pagothenia borchgrevinki]|uniref:Peptidase S1 domain-containing protein n=1 Tax=Pagothenia borchgrevinki TaxID=8213 RepID=A0ABD2HML1_PAGBO
MAGMMTSLLLLLLAGVTVGRVVDLQKRIIGGTQCAATDRLYHVRLKIQGVNLDCGGSLINKHWILTADHCVPKVGTESVKAFLRVNPDGTTNPVIIMTDDIKRNEPTGGLPIDIALLRLREAVTDDAIVHLPDCSKSPPQIFEITGHGATKVDTLGKRGTDKPQKLRCANTQFADCDHTIENPSYYSTYNTLICFKDDGVDITDGDSGGGLVFENTIYGVISFLTGDKPFLDPSGAIKVCEYIDWIRDVIENI